MPFTVVEKSPISPFSGIMGVIRDNLRSIISPKDQAFIKVFSDALRGTIEKEELKTFIEENTDMDSDYLADTFFERFDPQEKPRPPFDGTKNNPRDFELNIYLAAALKLAEETDRKLCLDEIRPDGQTDLHVAASGRPVRLKMLLAHKQPYNPNRRDLTGSTPLDVATQQTVDFILGLSSDQIKKMSDPNSEILGEFQDKKLKINLLFENAATDIHSRISANNIVETAIEENTDNPERQDHLEFLETISQEMENIRRFYIEDPSPR